jgi:AraC-like DNA-binding protein
VPVQNARLESPPPSSSPRFAELRGWSSALDEQSQAPGHAAACRVAGTVEAIVAQLSTPPCVLDDPGSPSFVLFVAKRYDCTTATANYGEGWEDHFLPRPLPIHLIPANAPNRWVVNGSAELIALSWRLQDLHARYPELAHVQPGTLEPLTRYGFEDELITRLMERIWLEASGGQAQGKLFVDSLFLTLMHALLARPATSAAPRPAGERLTPAQYKRVVDYMHANLHSDIGLPELAAVVGLSGSHFSRCFKAMAGCSPYRHLLGLRVAKARQLLATTSLRVAEIAQAVGFEDQSRLAKIFSRTVHVTPRAYRIQHRAGQHGALPQETPTRATKDKTVPA